MILEEFVKGFAEQFEDTDITEIQMDTVYQDLDEWSSLTAMSMSSILPEINART